MVCPYCNNNDNLISSTDSEIYHEDLYPDVEFINAIMICKNCGFGWNCVGTRKTETHK